MNKYKKMGVTAVMAMMVAMSATAGAYAMESPLQASKASIGTDGAIELSLPTADSEQAFIEYVKSLNVLNQQELDKLVHVSEESGKLYASLDSLLGKEKLTAGEQAELEAVQEKVNKLQESAAELYTKINAAEAKGGIELILPTADSEQAFIEYVKSLNVLNQQELDKLAEVSAKTTKLYASIADLLSKSTLTATEQAQLDQVLDQITRLQEGLDQTYKKIDSVGGFDKVLEEDVADVKKQ
ncbi:hypothetical protein [Paenibacillus sp. y28]|uniref:hypothetical protein n=1 Tax=Paenibacillus sp. y28 TaxID=3129110 RepID=UPI003016319F